MLAARRSNSWPFSRQPKARGQLRWKSAARSRGNLCVPDWIVDENAPLVFDAGNPGHATDDGGGVHAGAAAGQRVEGDFDHVGQPPNYLPNGGRGDWSAR